MEGGSRKRRADSGSNDEDQTRPEEIVSEANLEEAIRNEENSETSTPEDMTVNSHDDSNQQEGGDEPEPIAGPSRQSQSTHVDAVFAECMKLLPSISHQKAKTVRKFLEFAIEAIEAEGYRYKPPENQEEKKQNKGAEKEPTEVNVDLVLQDSEEDEGVQETIVREDNLREAKSEGDEVAEEVTEPTVSGVEEQKNDGQVEEEQEPEESEKKNCQAH